MHCVCLFLFYFTSVHLFQNVRVFTLLTIIGSQNVLRTLVFVFQNVLRMLVFGSQNVIFYGLFLVIQESFLNRTRTLVFGL